MKKNTHTHIGKQRKMSRISRILKACQNIAHLIECAAIIICYIRAAVQDAVALHIKVVYFSRDSPGTLAHSHIPKTCILG